MDLVKIRTRGRVGVLDEDLLGLRGLGFIDGGDLERDDDEVEKGEESLSVSVSLEMLDASFASLLESVSDELESLLSSESVEMSEDSEESSLEVSSSTALVLLNPLVMCESKACPAKM